jgi:hypothetical protein
VNNHPNPEAFFLCGTLLVLVGVSGRIFPSLMRIGWWSGRWDGNDRAWSLVFLNVAFFGIGAWKIFHQQ